jgi:class 3 adenylate cyclase/tetratricopeptide (TPR) repeat protein
MRCSACGTENEPGRKFCGECGAKLLMACPSCGASNAPDMKFCGECGANLREPAATAPPAKTAQTIPATAERRLVSVLFADLVGFTTLSESRDPEDVRELLTSYFDTCRTLIDRYGGTVEKFIGDAVMAVWGTPVATEHDAERAVRAALELTAAVQALGENENVPTLRARAGVLTGEAAVTLNAEGQGMVAGDLVNTASRIQSAAEPGDVLVGDSTKRATERAIVYEDSGSHELKGKAEPVSLWRAVRVISGALGAMKSEKLESPFVGRERELRLVKDLFHGSAEEGGAHLVSVVGVAGTGKSRLSWELFKYIDGVAFDVRWHRGRCLPYGEGVAFWALAEMVRTRFGILEGEDASSARAKLAQHVVTNVPDPDERRWVEPRLAVLLGLEEPGGRDLEGLFAAWRLFYERLAEEMPTVMVFEDLQWADAALLDFIEYLLEWSRGSRLFVITLARPELAERRPNWGAGGRNFTSIYLEPLAPEAMQALLTGLVPGLAEDLRERFLDRAEGVPLYLVETVRMLLDRGLLVQEGSSYAPTGPIETLDVPEGLQALIAARLDGLAPEERRLIQDASVLGKVFRRGGIAALSGAEGSGLDALLSSLVRKEVLGLQADALSPERGQYAFLQELVRKVAYETLSKKERKQKHLAAASYIESTWGPGEEEFVEVVANHYLEAYQLVPDAEDADDIRAHALGMLIRAGERAASVAAPGEAERYFERAAELAEDKAERAGLMERAAIMAAQSGRTPRAIEWFQESIEIFESVAMTHPAARVSARLASFMWASGRSGDAAESMERSFQVLSRETPDADSAVLAAELGRALFFAGRPDDAYDRIEWALDVAEALDLPEVLSQALNTKAVILYSARGRRREAYALLRDALEIALEADAPAATLRAYFNLADFVAGIDRYGEAADLVRKGLAYARRVGDRFWEWQLLSQAYGFLVLGEWDEVLDMAAALPPEAPRDSRVGANTFLLLTPLILLARGEPALAREDRNRFPPIDDASGDVQERADFAAGKATLLSSDGRHKEAITAAWEAIELRGDVGLQNECVKEAIIVAAEEALAIGDTAEAERILSVVEEAPPGRRPVSLQAHAMRFRARMAAASGDLGASETGLRGAIGLFREMSAPFWIALAELDLAELLTNWGREQEARELLEEARNIFARLKAKPWLDRLDRVGAGVRVEASD